MASRIEAKERAREARIAAEHAERRTATRKTAILRLGLVLGLAVVAVVVAIVLSSGGGTPTTTGGKPAAATGLFSGIPQKGVTLGQPGAKATLIEFADLQCPFCADYSNQALPTIVKDYVRTGKIRYELRLRSFLGKDSVTAAGAAAVAAEQNRLYQFADVFYARQGQENTGYVNDTFLRKIAVAAGVDPTMAVAAAHDPAGQRLVATAEQKAASLGSNGTPDFYLKLASGRLVKVSPQDLTGPSMSQALDQALAQT